MPRLSCSSSGDENDVSPLSTEEEERRTVTDEDDVHEDDSVTTSDRDLQQTVPDREGELVFRLWGMCVNLVVFFSFLFFSFPLSSLIISLLVDLFVFVILITQATSSLPQTITLLEVDRNKEESER